MDGRITTERIVGAITEAIPAGVDLVVISDAVCLIGDRLSSMSHVSQVMSQLNALADA